MMPLNPKISRRVSNQHVGDAKILPAVLNLSDVMGPVEDIAPAPATITRNFLDSLAGLPVHDAKETVEDAGLTPNVIPFGNGIATAAYANVILLWEAEDRCSVEKATCGDPLQLVEDE